MTAQDDADTIRDTLSALLPQMPEGPARNLVQLMLHSVNDETGRTEIDAEALTMHLIAAIAIQDVRLTALEQRL